MNRSGRSTILLVASLTVAVLVAIGLMLASGCKKRGASEAETKTAEKKADPWETVSRRLRKDTDLAACKTALGQLNNDLSERSDIAGSTVLSEDGAKALGAIVPLSHDEVAELRQSSYSSLDPAYVADCFYLHDAARSLEPAGLPPADRARVGFAWVCRQLFLQPWLFDGVVPVPAIPPTYALRRGSGSGLERAYVFLALLQQMGLDGCLIGPPGAVEKSTLDSAGKGGKNAVDQKGPFWAVGVRVGSDILLFEPWRGEPFPGPNGQGVGTLAQIRANPDQLKAWFEDKGKPWNLKPDDIKNASVVLAVPVSAMSPRMAMLEQKLKAENGVHLAMDPMALRARFMAAAPEGPGLVDVKFWNPPKDPYAYGRVLQTFLPVEDGGIDRADPGSRLHSLYMRSMVPPNIVSLPGDLHPQVKLRFFEIIMRVYEASFFAAPSPRERIQRGQFQDAARDLTDKLAAFGRGQERLRLLEPGEIEEWVKTANGLYDNLNAKRFPNIGQTTPQPDTDPDVAEARGAVEEFWRGRDSTSRVIVDRSTASIGRSEASFLLALAKHEEAERLQLSADHPGGTDPVRARETAANAWLEASNAWNAFLEQNGPTASVARTDHAKTLAARAKKFTAGK